MTQQHQPQYRQPGSSHSYSRRPGQVVDNFAQPGELKPTSNTRLAAKPNSAAVNKVMGVIALAMAGVFVLNVVIWLFVAISAAVSVYFWPMWLLVPFVPIFFVWVGLGGATPRK